MEKNKRDYVQLNKVSKIYKCTRNEIVRIVSLGKLKIEKFKTGEGEFKLYVKKDEVKKLFGYRKTNKGNNND